MIEHCAVLTRGGIVLWQSNNTTDTSYIKHAINNHILLDKPHAAIPYKHFTVATLVDNTLNIITTALYLDLTQTDAIQLLTQVNTLFAKAFTKHINTANGNALPNTNIFQFDQTYANIELQFKKNLMNNWKGAKPRTYDEVKTNPTPSKDVKEPEAKSVDLRSQVETRNKPRPFALKKIKGKKDQDTEENGESAQKQKKGKSARNWNYPAGAADLLDKDALDRSGKNEENIEENNERVKIEKQESEDESVSDKEVVDSELVEPEAKDSSNGMLGYFSGLLNGRELNKEDLIKPLEGIRQTLLAKNVAAEIVDQICTSVAESLSGKKISSFTTIKSVVKSTLEETLTRVLTPKRHIDIVREALQARSEGRPYSIVFVGVNGVGKSTSLAKICYYLLARELKVSIAACDTFRSGAVEQLKTHARRLGVEVFQQGYNKDASAVASEGIRMAKKRGDDVILIDTAGRMQDNEPLMRALSKLIVQNAPDLVLFVGEALVGNEAVDQLVKFNRCLSELSSVGGGIDGIVLSKFDTVDDKVGCAISLTYSTGHPILFVGVGQDYGDLRRLSVHQLVHKLIN
jgi:signal recognition particle GTPase